MSAPAEVGPATERECPRCGSTAGPLQEYCLECGARLPPDPVAGPPRRRIASAATWPLLVSGVIALLAAALVVAVQLTTDDDRPDLVVATTEQPELPEPTPPPEPVPTTVPEPPAPPPTQTQPPAQNRVVSWPEGRRGWTVVIASLPESQGRQAATAKAREALQSGLPQAGVLVSSRFSSLHPGYLVVFSGVFEARAGAEERASRARARGYGTAYAREIAP